MDPERTIKVNGHQIEEYWWNGELIVYVDCRLFDGTYEEAQRHFWRIDR